MEPVSLEPIIVTRQPFNAGTPLPALISHQTPLELVYVRNHFDTPRVDPAEWALAVVGSVDRPLSLTLDEIRERPASTLEMVLECAGNGRTSMRPVPAGTPWDFNAVSRVSFTGIPLHTLLEEAGIHEQAVEVIFSGADRGEVEPGREERYVRSLPLAIALKPNTLAAWEMNSQPLTAEHGYPLRLVVPGLYGMASVKWLQEIAVVEEPFQGFFQSEHYVYKGEAGTREGEPVKDIRVRSLITRPADGEALTLGKIRVHGIAWTGQGEITRVQLSLDGGESWSETDLARKSPQYGGREWRFDWEPASAGVYTLFSRATDSDGNTQPLSQRWNRLGYGNNGVQSVTVVILG